MDDTLDFTFEHCPHCRARLEPEAACCTACGRALFDTGPDDSRGPDFRQDEDMSGDPIELLGEDGSYPVVPPSEFQDLVPVVAGDLPKLMALRASLGAQGFETYINNDKSKVIDPLIVGGYLFGSTLMAPARDAEAIRRILKVAEAAAREREDPNEMAVARLKRIERMLFLALVFFPPAGAVMGFYYFGLLREVDYPPRRWVGGIALWMLSLAGTAILVWFVLSIVIRLMTGTLY